jgi:hypothetical protein
MRQAAVRLAFLGNTDTLGQLVAMVTKPDRAQPRYLAKAASRAVTPINPAAQKFHRFILCSAFDSSVTLSGSSLPCFMWGKRHMADRNQNAAEPHAVIITPVSMNDLIVIP